MRQSVRRLLFPTALAVVALNACTPNGETIAPQIEMPSALSSNVDVETARNLFIELETTDARRAGLRDLLLGHYIELAEEQLVEQHFNEALSHLESAVFLYRPDELKRSPQQDRLSSAAWKAYTHFSKHGLELPSALSLAIAHAFATPADKIKYDAEWQMLIKWLNNAQDYPGRFQRAPSLSIQDVLESVTASFPSPWLVDELVVAYRNQISLVNGERAHLYTGTHDRQRAEFAGFLLIRTLLRSNRLDEVKQSLEVLKGSSNSQVLSELVQRAIEAPENAQAQNDLIYHVTSQSDQQGVPRWVVIQSWSIVLNLSQRTLEKHPEDSHAHLARAKALRFFEFHSAAIAHYEKAIELDEGLFEAWTDLAELRAQHLISVSEQDIEEGLSQLNELEAFHERATRLWPDRPIRPGMAVLHVTLAAQLFDNGRPDEALELLNKSVQTEPLPSAINLLGTIAMRDGDLAKAREHYENLVTLPYEDQADRVDWEIRARTHLGELSDLDGGTPDGQQHLKLALQQLNLYLTMPRMSEAAQSRRLLERCRVLFLLGDIGQAMNDCRKSAAATPDRPASYAEPLLLAASRGHHPEAHEIFERAVGRKEIPGPLRMYFSIWMVDLARRANQPLTPSAVNFLENYSGEPWHKSLASHALEKTPSSSLIEQAITPGKKAEAYFYIGLRQWHAGQRTEALDMMRKVIDTHMMSFVEYELAQYYLSRGEIPTPAPLFGN